MPPYRSLSEICDIYFLDSSGEITSQSNPNALARLTLRSISSSCSLLEATLEILPKGSRQIGFYSYGEISPYKSGACDLHNQTMTLTTIAEH